MLYAKFFKRLFDLLVTIPFLLLVGPVMGVIALLVRIKLGQPVIFRQARSGLHKKPFINYKFRSMTEKLDQNGNLLPDEKRVTDFGLFLRGTSLDELPELFNVLKGDMSLVGPRPLPVRYLERYTTEQIRRNEAKPGLTGWVQVNGRNAIEWEKKFKLDVWYVDNQSFILDFKILWMTFKKVISQEGISSEGEVSAPEFFGSKGTKSDINESN